MEDMAEKIEVKPTPIQRNVFDVAMELTQLHFDKFGVDGDDCIKDKFAEHYALVTILKSTSSNNKRRLEKFIPEEILSKLI